jgi:ABC-2 type transport system permease protein
MVWTALYAHNAAPGGLPLHAIITYATVALLMGLVLDIDQTRLLHEKLNDGSIATDFMKPISVPLYFFSDGTGEVVFHAFLIVPALLLSFLFVHIDVPAPAVFASFALSFLLGYFVGFFLNFLLNCVAFWTLEISAVQLILTWVTDLLGGAIIPLVLFPPLSIYVGQIRPAQYPAALGSQVVWLAILAASSAIVWRAGARRVVVQGG